MHAGVRSHIFYTVNAAITLSFKAIMHINLRASLKRIPKPVRVGCFHPESWFSQSVTKESTEVDTFLGHIKGWRSGILSLT